MKIRDIIPVALGNKEPDVLLTNLHLVNVFTGEIEETNIALYRKRIAGIGDYTSGKKIIDLKGGYVVPGFIDAHLHIESSMLAPQQFAEAILLRGTTTVIADPHEITNVLGIRGIEYIINATEGIPLNVYIAIPSAVPATHMETAGSYLGPEDIVGFVDTYPQRIIALGEVMNFPGVLNMNRELITKIEILRHKYKKIDGHAPGLTGKPLNAYIDAFIRSDHECTTKEEALEKASKGMQIFIREGSAAKNLDGLIPAVSLLNHGCFSFCTDDRDPFDIMNHGHIDYLIRHSIKQGIDPVIAIRMATINTARYFNLRSMGAIAPGYKADMVVLDNLKDFNITSVIKDSEVVVKDGTLLNPMQGIYKNIPLNIGRITLPPFTTKDLAVPAQEKNIRVIEMTEGSLFTKELILKPTIKNNCVAADPERDIAKIVIFERHTGTGYSIGFVKGTGLLTGAAGTSVGHDSHNISVAGMNDEDITTAVREIEKMNGGMVIVNKGKVLWRLELPIAGLMSHKNLFHVVQTLKEQKEVLHTIGCEKNLFMAISFIQLAVIPEIKITDQGLVDVIKQEFVDLFTD
ncbi:MAG: adenine deaminase [Spirochaetales bacterium]|nr:adenine deaminase [Spirochaetales bacterium]